MRVSVNIIQDNHNARKTCGAMAEGIMAVGHKAVIRRDTEDRMDGFDASVFWGFTSPCQNLVRACQTKGIPWIFIDLGYWRRELNYYKVCVNSRHPTAYFQKTPRPPDRFARLGLEVGEVEIKGDNYILLAGMSGKAAWAWKLENQEYEVKTAAELSKLTTRRIVYRPKPNWAASKAIPGTVYDKTTPLHMALLKTHCVVTHHSNVAIDATLMGIPVLCKYGAASVLYPYELQRVDTIQPLSRAARLQWAADVAYCQWSLHEMRTGVCWRNVLSVLGR